VKGYHIAVIQLVDVVAGQDEDRLIRAALKIVEVLVNGIGGATVGADPGSQYLAVSGTGIGEAPLPDVFLQVRVLVIRQHGELAYLRTDTVAETEIDYPESTGERQRRLGPKMAEDIHPFTPAPGQDDGGGIVHGRVPPSYGLKSGLMDW
jgi:hypothetical protein